MTYAEFQALAAYQSKHTGAAIQVVILDEEDPTVVVIGATTGINSGDDFEAVPVEEAGNEGVDEIAQGRHTVSGSIPAFWTPAWNDALPTRASFIGRTYTLIEKIAEGRDGAGVVVNAYTGCRITRVSGQMSARGGKMIDLAFTGEQRYSGAEWAVLTGA